MTSPRILVITLSNIGDAIMTTPVLAVLHAQFPAARIDLVCDPRSSALFEACPYIGQRFVRDKKTGWAGYVQLIRALRQTRYDIMVDLRTDFLVYLLRGQQKFKKRSNHSTLHLHSVTKHLSAISHLVGERAPCLQLWASEQDQRMVAAQFPTPGRWLAIGPGANFAGKIWPIDRYVAVANALAAHIDGVVLLGSAADHALAKQFIAQAMLPVYDACGRLSLPQSYALLKQCQMYLGNDSGLGHIAAAAGLPTLTLFGPGSPVRYLPWSTQASFIQNPQHNILGIMVQAVVDRLHPLLPQRAVACTANTHIAR
ncbi:glycosyltransferase family 9 protein [Methylophilus sp.]|uniref:glycosyltransferase family 9 protein n=1 Tax=Methylophilus sp. TaxID=29541 RepID=UPI0011D80DFF|nr:glycosyltransferase family 9 protein [Methylophilus sp.]TXI44050.1 MAG: glycosyltransferase family 9 protein [Methylophilus sp.]